MRKGSPSLFHSRIGFRLWCVMMVLVLFSIGFMWFVQISLFEQNYADSAIADVQSRLEPIMEDLKTEDLAGNDKLIRYLSKSTSGKMMITGGGGELYQMYSYGHPIDLDTAEATSLVWHTIKDSKEFENILLGQQYKKIYRDGNRITAFEIGMPVLYDGQMAYVILYHALDEVNTVQSINRRQLVTLSIVLTIAASLLAAVFSRQFISPIFAIKGTVDKLAKGELEATPGLSRKDELGQLSQSVEELGQALQRVDVLRKELIANVSHELRSPLSLIMGYGELVRDVSWSDQAGREEHLNLIIGEARRMSEMVGDILDYSQLQAGYLKLNREPHNLYDIVETETGNCRQSAEQHGVTITLDSVATQLPVEVDALKISQVMRNLLYNAINHTGDGQDIQIHITREKEGLRVAVVNPGEPIPEEERQLIWERYHRSQHQNGRRQGTGLGLSIVSTILDSHGMPFGVACGNGLIEFWFVYPQK